MGVGVDVGVGTRVGVGVGSGVGGSVGVGVEVAARDDVGVCAVIGAAWDNSSAFGVGSKVSVGPGTDAPVSVGSEICFSVGIVGRDSASFCWTSASTVAPMLGVGDGIVEHAAAVVRSAKTIASRCITKFLRAGMGSCETQYLPRPIHSFQVQRAVNVLYL